MKNQKLFQMNFLESAWVMTRDRLPVGPVMQRAYGVLDKYQLSRNFFIKTDQKNCDILPIAQEAYDPTEPSSAADTPSSVTEKKKKPATSSAAGGHSQIKEKAEEVDSNVNMAPPPIISESAASP